LCCVCGSYRGNSPLISPNIGFFRFYIQVFNFCPNLVICLSVQLIFQGWHQLQLDLAFGNPDGEV